MCARKVSKMPVVDYLDEVGRWVVSERGMAETERAVFAACKKQQIASRKERNVDNQSLGPLRCLSCANPKKNNSKKREITTV